MSGGEVGKKAFVIAGTVDYNNNRCIKESKHCASETVGTEQTVCTATVANTQSGGPAGAP